MSSTVRVAGVQMDVCFADPAANLNAMAALAAEAAKGGAKLVVFPECAIPGYCFESLAEAMPWAEEIPGPSVQALQAICRRHDLFVVAGMLERDGPKIYNVCVLVGPEGLVGCYRKAHLPFLGVDRFTTPGDRPFAVWQAGPLCVGMLICYDSSFPEAARVLALQGADLIALPTNWPAAARCVAQCAVNTRAMENHLYFMAVNRVGTERGTAFIGLSKICGPEGNVLDEAPSNLPAIVYADIDPTIARNKHLIRQRGVHEIHRFRDRRPDLYGPLVDPQLGQQ